MAGTYKYLFTPLKIGSVTVPNRICLGPHATGFEDHVENFALIGERNEYYFRERARGGVGLMILGIHMAHPTAGDTGSMREIPHGYRPEMVERYRRLGELIHPYGTKIFIQLNHTGVLNYGDHQDDYYETWGVSYVPGLGAYGANKEMEKEDIEELVNGYALVAKHAKEGGMDGVEVHGAHGYLIHQFLSQVSNKRTDEYGGSLENRMRFLMEVIQRIRATVGRDFPMGVRLSADGLAPGDVTMEQCKEVAKRLEATQLVDYLSISAGSQWTAESFTPIIPPFFCSPGFMLPFAAAIKSEVKSIPIFCVGRINDPALAERALAEGQADMVVMIRELLCEPEFAKKAQEGREDDIRACMGCQACAYRAENDLPLNCIQNPGSGREKRLGVDTLEPAKMKKKVVVVGGGVAGLKAAEIAAARGHEVTLFEREAELGGQVTLMAKTPLHTEFASVVDYLVKQITKRGVDIHLNEEATADKIKGLNADAVVVATGCNPIRTIFIRKTLTEGTVPGVDQDNVVSIFDVLKGKLVGNRVLMVLADRHDRNIQTAVYLASEGKEVIVAGPLPDIVPDRMHPSVIPHLRRKINEYKVRLMLRRSVEKIEGNSVFLTTRDGQTEKVDNLDTIIWASGARPDDKLYFELKGQVKELYRIGDCVAPRYVGFAIFEGEKVGRAI